MNSSESLTLQYWNIYVVDGFNDFLRGDYNKVTEMHVPELNISINTGTSFNKSVNVLSITEERYKPHTGALSGPSPSLIKTVQIDGSSEEAKAIKFLAHIKKEKEQHETTIKTMFSEYEEKYEEKYEDE